MSVNILQGDCLEQLKTLPDNHFHCCVTSPPYWGLRSYLPGDSLDKKRELGCERTAEEYVENMVAVFREVRRVLHPTGTFWLNIGDCWAGSNGNGYKQTIAKVNATTGQEGNVDLRKLNQRDDGDCKPKDLVGIPWMLAFALRKDGWWLRQEIIWCLSGGVWLYAKTKNSGICIMSVRDLYRNRGQEISLWNGEKWTPVLGVSRSERKGNEVELVLRSGERISCTPTHKWPTKRGILEASELVVGDVLASCELPPPEEPRDCSIDVDAAWFAGLYLAEGSLAGDTIQLSGNSSETERWNRIQEIVRKFGGTATITNDGNKQNIRCYGKILLAIISEFISGKTAKNKCLSPSAWRYGNGFLRSLIDGYLEGDGHIDKINNRWRLGFCRNYSLERDLRIACARLGYHLILNPTFSTCNGKRFPSFRGELRYYRTGHFNEKSPEEIVEIRKARCREVYDIGVLDEPHIFSLASGILTHNSKPNPMPESVLDRCTKSHEHIFLLTKSRHYFFDSEAIKEPTVDGESFRNKRDVWSINVKPYRGAHFATYPEELVIPCIKAGSSETGCCPQCGTPWERIVERVPASSKPCPKTQAAFEARGGGGVATGTVGKSGGGRIDGYTKTIGWKQNCKCIGLSVLGGSPPTITDCPYPPVPCRVLDPFGGSGTTAQVATSLGREATLIELNAEYIKLINQRIQK